MTRSALPFVLAGRSRRTELDPGLLDSHTATKAARFWAGNVAGSQAKAACAERIAGAWRDRSRIAEVVAALLPEERELLAVVRRFGGTISGNLLGLELRARGIGKERMREEPAFRRGSSKDLVLGLCERLVLLKDPGYHSSYSSGAWREYPRVTLPREIAVVIAPAASLEWRRRPRSRGPRNRRAGGRLLRCWSTSSRR